MAAERKIAGINADVRVTAIVDDVNHSNIEQLAEGAQVIVDGLDNLETRYLANDVAVKHALPYVYGAVVGTTGMALAVLPHGDGSAPWERGENFATPCFRCLFEELPPPGSSPTCDTIGVLSSAVAQVAAFQVSETIKILTGHYSQVAKTLLSFDAWTNELRQLRVAAAREQGNCPCCKGREFEFLSGRAGSAAAVLCGRNAVQLRPRRDGQAIGLDALAARLGAHGDVRNNDYMLRTTIEDGGRRFELSLFGDGRAIIKGTDSIDVARSLYARYVGV